jgi:hypothetical protein
MECCHQQTLKGNKSGSCKASKKLGAIQSLEASYNQSMPLKWKPIFRKHNSMSDPVSTHLSDVNETTFGNQRNPDTALLTDCSYIAA